LGMPSHHRIPPEITLELSSGRSDFTPRIRQVVSKAAAGDPAEWLKNLQNYLAEGDAMVVNARMGRTLVGFLVLDSANAASPFSWVDERFRNKGLGQRFYSFACINLAMPTPEFRFPQDMLDEYRDVLRSVGTTPVLKNSYYVVHDRAVDDQANQNELEPFLTVAQPSESSQSAGPRRLVIDDGDWIGFSHHDSRRLKLRVSRLPRLVQD